jgi:hypothetical protein
MEPIEPVPERNMTGPNGPEQNTMAQNAEPNTREPDAPVLSKRALSVPGQNRMAQLATAQAG